MRITTYRTVLLCVFLVALVNSKGGQGKKNGRQEAGGLTIERNNTNVNSDMFKMNAKNNPNKTMHFGFARIEELDSAKNFINATKHFCNFTEHNVVCTTGDMILKSRNATDEDGYDVMVDYEMIITSCNLSVCNANPNATLLINTSIILDDAYLCQGDCESNDTANSTTTSSKRQQTPVSRGTAKWDIELSNWDFCETNKTECNNTVGEHLKIYFTIGGKDNGKSKKMGRKKPKPWKASNMTCGNMTSEDKGDDEGEDKRDPQQRKAPGGGKEGKPGKDKPGKDKPGQGPDGNGPPGRNKNKGKPRHKPPRCKGAANSLGGRPDDQIGYMSDGENATIMRFFCLAVLDDTKIVVNGSGIVCPTLEEKEVFVGQHKKNMTFVTVSVEKFAYKMSYDPTADMSEDGGSGATEDVEEEVEVISSGNALTAGIVLITAVLTVYLA